MPANLPPAYYAAEERMRSARTPADKIACLEEMITSMPKHKGTDKLKADLRRKISKFKQAIKGGKSGARRNQAFVLEPEGAGQVMVVGAPNTGKSSLVRALTKAAPAVEDFPMSTWKPTPGMMHYEDIQMQLVDTPPIDYQRWRPELFDMIRRSDAVLIVVDSHADPEEQLRLTLSALESSRIAPSRFVDQYRECSRALYFLPMTLAANKCDSSANDELGALFVELIDSRWGVCLVSAKTGRGLDRLREALFECIGVMRIYTKPRGKEPDYSAPYTIPRGASVEDFARKVHMDFARQLKGARVWGGDVHSGQLVQRDHVLHDRDVVELYM